MPLFFFNDTATTEIYTLSLHDALPILPELLVMKVGPTVLVPRLTCPTPPNVWALVPENDRVLLKKLLSPFPTSGMQSRPNVDCCLIVGKTDVAVKAALPFWVTPSSVSP